MTCTSSSDAVEAPTTPPGGRGFVVEEGSVPRQQKSTTQRGLGWDHQKQRERLLRLHVDGSPCAWCGQPMWRDTQELDADHEQARSLGGTRADRLLHASCNRQRGDGTRDNKTAEANRAERAKWTTRNWG